MNVHGAATGAPTSCAKNQFYGEFLHAHEDTYAHRDTDNAPYGAARGHLSGGESLDYTYNHKDALGRNWQYNDARTSAMEHGVFDLFVADFHKSATLRSGATISWVTIQSTAADFNRNQAPETDHALVTVYGGDIEIDLAGKTLHADATSSGVVAYARSNHRWAEDEHRDFGLETRRVTIRNGTVDLRTGIRLIEWWLLTNADEKVPPETAAGYQPTAFVLEDPTIKTDHNAIELEGDGNIVRRCKIESSGNIAVALAGPNGLVTDNQIIFKEPTIPTDLASISRTDISLLWQAREARRLTRAVILLRQASGTTIANNRITLEGESSTRHSVYVRDGSQNVKVRNNTSTGVTHPVMPLEGSSAEVADNVFVK